MAKTGQLLPLYNFASSETSPTIKQDISNKVTWKWTAKNILDFAWAADRDYSVESFPILDGPKVYLVYQLVL